MKAQKQYFNRRNERPLERVTRVASCVVAAAQEINERLKNSATDQC